MKREKDAFACYLKAWHLAPYDGDLTNRLLNVGPRGPQGATLGLNGFAWKLATRADKYRNPRKALEYAEEVVKADPKQGDFQTTLGVARYRTGDWAGAVSALQEALRCFEGEKDFQPGVGRSLFFLSMAQQKAGHGPEARQTYERALAWVKANRQVLEKTAWGGGREVPRVLTAWAGDEMRRFQTEAEEVLGEKEKK